MKNYEMVVIFKPDLEAEEQDKVLNRIYDYINAEGKVGETDDWGKRKLAYEINYITEGHYMVINFEAPASSILEIERRIKIHDQLIRYMIVSKES